MTEVNEKLVHTVWKLLEQGLSAELIANPEPDDKDRLTSEQTAILLPTGGVHGIFSKRTVERLESILNGFKSGLPISARAGYTKGRVKELYDWWLEYLRTKVPEEYARHLGDMANLAAKLRGRLVGPDIPRQKYTETSAWQWGGYDWRLSPVTWFRVMTPDLDDDSLWEEQLPNLKDHLAGASFWEHYRRLKKDVEELEAEYHEAARAIAEHDPDFGKSWAEVNDKITHWVVAEWLPDRRPQPEQAMDFPYSREFCEETMKALGGRIAGLGDRLRKMEHLLQDLWDDLNPDLVNPLIRERSCKNCPGVTNKPSDSSQRETIF